MRRRSRALAVALLGVVVAASGCSSWGAAASERASTAVPARTTLPVELTVYGAASLKEVLAAVETAYEAAGPGATLTIATDSSATLRTQIEQGAPADLFLSADLTNAQALVDAGLTDGDAVEFATNALMIVVPGDNPAGLASPRDLAMPGLKIVAAGDEVPISAYARQVISHLAGVDGYPTDFAAAYAANVVSKEENVKAVVAKIELGEADAAIVYVTDARSSDRVMSIAIPPEANVAASYAGVVVHASTHGTAARDLLDWLVSPAGFRILEGFGFGPPR